MSEQGLSPYEELKAAVAQYPGISFTGSTLSHGQGAEVTLSLPSGKAMAENQKERLSFFVYEFAQRFLYQFSMVGPDEFELNPRIEGSALLFDLTMFDDGSNYWETSDPLYRDCVSGLHENVAKALLAEKVENIDAEALIVSLKANLDDEAKPTCLVCVKVDRDLYGDAEYLAVQSKLEVVEATIETLLARAISEHQAAINSAGCSEYSVSLELCFQPLVPGEIDATFEAVYELALDDALIQSLMSVPSSPLDDI